MGEVKRDWELSAYGIPKWFDEPPTSELASGSKLTFTARYSWPVKVAFLVAPAAVVYRCTLLDVRVGADNALDGPIPAGAWPDASVYPIDWKRDEWGACSLPLRPLVIQPGSNFTIQVVNATQWPIRTSEIGFTLLGHEIRL